MDRFAYQPIHPDDGGSHMVRFRDLPRLSQRCDMADAVEQRPIVYRRPGRPACAADAVPRPSKPPPESALFRSRCISLQNWRCLRQWKEPVNNSELARRLE